MNKYNLTTDQRIRAFAELGNYLSERPQELVSRMDTAGHHNPWFTIANINEAMSNLVSQLTIDELSRWVASYKTKIEYDSSKAVGLVLAGNIPLVGFHDILAVLMSGCIAKIKLSSDDNILIPFILDQLIKIEPAFQNKIDVIDRLKGFDMIIATGSNNTSRYFEYYFKHVPHIIRKNRNSLAILNGSETHEELHNLGRDLFNFYGLGCRSVSKLFIPEDYKIEDFFVGIESMSDVINHHKYANNYDYNKSIYLINGDQHYDNGFLLLKEDSGFSSPLAVCYYERYKNVAHIEKLLNESADRVQCVITKEKLNIKNSIFDFGQSQCPALDDYADNINTIDFLLENK